MGWTHNGGDRPTMSRIKVVVVDQNSEGLQRGIIRLKSIPVYEPGLRKSKK